MRNSSMIQALRGLAAIAVVIFHQRILLDPDASVTILISHFYLGVDVFFIISGFVIAISTAKRANSFPLGFVVRRIFRIAPLAWTVIALELLIVHADLGLVIRGLLFLPENPPTTYPLNIPQWTLSYEFFFYAIFAASLAISHRYRCEISVLIVLAFAAMDFMLPASGDPFRSFIKSGLLLEFAAGVALAKGLSYIPATAPKGWPAGFGVLAIFCGVILCGLRPIEPGIFNFGCGAALIFAGLLMIERFIGLPIPRWLFWLGEVSYALYISQMFVAMFVDSKLFWTPLHKTWIYRHTSGFSRIALVLFFSLLISALMHVFIEKRGIAAGRRLADKIGRQALAQPATG